jgi:hypothetical protein
MDEGEKEGSILSYSSHWGKYKEMRAKGYTGVGKMLDSLSRLPLGDREAEVRERMSRHLTEALSICRSGGAISANGIVAASSESEMSLDSRYRTLIELAGVIQEPAARAKGHIIKLPESPISEFQTIHFYARNIMNRLGYWITVGGAHIIYIDSKDKRVSVEKGLEKPIENYIRRKMEDVVLGEDIKLPFKSLVHQALLDVCKTEGLNKDTSTASEQ